MAIALISQDKEPIRPGYVYVAPPNAHLIVEPGWVRVYRGPCKFRHRPSVNLLFRSAAVSYRSRVVGVVLTGRLNDGTAGLLAIKRRSGVAVVQDPSDVDFPAMPTNALETVEVDYLPPIRRMGAVLQKIVQRQAPVVGEAPWDIMREITMVMRVTKEDKQ